MGTRSERGFALLLSSRRRHISAVPAGKGSFSDPAHFPPEQTRNEPEMSYNSRQKKREARQARAAVERNRKKHPERWYLTPVTRNCCCNGCGGSLREGAEFVYRHTPREILCRVCADSRGIAPRPSARWDKKNRRRRRSRSSA